MVTNATTPDEPDRLAEARLAIETGMREAITGDSVKGSIRLYLLAAVIAGCLALAPFPANLLGIVAEAWLLLDGGRR